MHRLAEAPGRIAPAELTPLVARRGDVHQTRWLSPVLGSGRSLPGLHRRSIKGKATCMKALVYHGPGQRGWDTVDDPTIIDPTDIVVRIDSSTICGTDLHILKGDVPETTPGTVLGHEAVGTVQEIGAERQHRRRRRPGAAVVRELVRALPLLQGGPLRPVPRRRRVDLRAH